jgi:hypothetical protein
MTTVQTVWAVIAALITIAGLVIAFARLPPEDAKANLGKWANAMQLPLLASLLRSIAPQLTKIGAAMIVAGSVSFGGLATNSFFERFFETPETRQKFERDKATLLQQLADQANGRPPVSGFLSLHDSDRWRLARDFHYQTVNLGNGKPCEARLWSRPNDKSADGLALEIKQVIEVAGWRLEGGRNAKNTISDGVTINVATDNGPAYSCAYRLYEMLEEMKIKPLALRVNLPTPDLVECKDCAEIIFGTSKAPER